MPAKTSPHRQFLFRQPGNARRTSPDPKTGDPKVATSQQMRKIIDIVEESQRILADFIGSEAEEEIKTSTILGRKFLSSTNRMMP